MNNLLNCFQKKRKNLIIWWPKWCQHKLYISFFWENKLYISFLGRAYVQWSVITGPVRIRTHVQFWTRVRIATCPVFTDTGHKLLPSFFFFFFWRNISYIFLTGHVSASQRVQCSLTRDISCFLLFFLFFFWEI